MRKLKLLFAIAALMLGVGGASAQQQDVTATYLTNANFSVGTPIDNGICTYGKDMAGNNTTYYGAQEVSGWTSASVGASADGYEGNGLAGGIFAYGGTPFLGGSGYTAPAEAPAGSTGNTLGLMAVWGNKIQYTKDVTLPAGSYTLRFNVYNATSGSGNSSGIITTNLFGFVPNEGTAYYAPNKTFAIGQWSTIAVTFKLTAETAGKISMGFVGPDGSGAMPHLFVDNVKILKNTYYEDVTNKVNKTAWTGASDGYQGGSINTARKYGDKAIGRKIYQTVSGLSNGTYEVVLYSISQKEWNGTLASDAGDVAYVFAEGNSELKEWINARARNSYPGDDKLGIYTISGVEVTDGTLTIGMGLAQANLTEWHHVQIHSLIYTKNLDLSGVISAYETALANAQAAAAKTDPMQTSLMVPLNEAISTYGNVDRSDGDAMGTATAALSAATDAVNHSIAAYANAKEYLDKMGAILEGTNVYTQEAYNQYYGTWLSGYNAKTLETATAEGLNANIAYSTGWHSNNYVDDILLSTWTFGGEQCSNYDKDLYINTWSVEGNTDGSEFYTPFFEYWVSSGSLKPTTLVSTITGLKANTTYSFTIRARVQGTTEKIANGITMKVGEGTAVDISAGAQFNGGNFYIGNFSAVGQTDAEGKLVTTITVAENSNISWLSFYNCKYTEGEDLSAYIADYEFALDNVNTALTNDVAYDAMQTDLKAAATTYAKGSVDETSKTALIAAKEALEAALAAYYEIVGPLKGNNISKWTTTGNNGSFQVNTWSGEGNSDGSNMKTPFTQNWINRGTNLTDATMSYTVEGLTPGYYRVTALIRSLNEAGGATPAGSFIFANDAIERAYGTNSSVCTNGVYGNPVVYGLVGEDGKLTIGVKIIKANVNWVSWKNFIYTYEGTELTQAIADNLTEEARTFANTGADAAVAQTDAISALSTLSDANYTAAGQAIEAAYKAIDRDFTTLKEALAAVAAGTLGFEVGEFAPYNTIAAKAIDQTSEANTQAEIDEAAAICVANAVEVNAFYDGDFSECAEDNASPLDYTPAGWTASENFRMMLKDTETYPGLADASIPSAVFTWSGGVTYGEQAGYEMPLKANTVYTLKFKAAGWENQTRSGMTVSILNGNDGMAAYNLGTPDRDIKGNEHNTAGMTSYEYVFATGAAGNYVFHIQSGNNMVMTDFEIKKAASQELAFADNTAMPKYAPGTYPTVKVSRTLTENNWATAVYPFEVSKEDVGNIAVLDSYDSENNEVGFSTVPSSKANEPFLMKSSATKSEIVLSNVEVAEAKAANAVIEPLSFIGVYTQTEVEQGADVKNFVLKDNTIYRIGENAATLNPYRAYFQVAQPVEQARLSFFIDGQQTTGLSEELRVKGQEFATAPVYNLNGQRVEKPNKGLYISNGKKVVLK